MAELPAHHGSRRQDSSRELPWTVARCNRLLRSLSSRIVAIRKLINNRDMEYANVTGSLSAALQRRTRTAVGAKDEAAKADDPEWMPQTGSTVSRTYSARPQSRKLPAVSQSEPDEKHSNVAPWTPCLRKLLRPKPDDSPLVQPAVQGGKDGHAQTEETQRSRKLPIKPATTVGEMHQQLRTAFCRFVKDTAPLRAPSREGAKSFREMCVNRLPAYIQHDQAWLDDQDEQSGTNAADETYALLDDQFGTGDDADRPGLRQVVRSHGLHLITTAIEDGALFDDYVRQLVKFCTNFGSLMDGQQMLRSWARAIDRAPSYRRLDMFMTTAQEMRTPHSLLRDLGHLADAGIVFNERLSCLKQRMISCIGTGGQLDAMQFLQAYAVAMRRSPMQATCHQYHLPETHRALAALITAVIWSQRQETESVPTNTSLAWQLHRLSLTLYTSHDADIHTGLVRPYVLGSLIAMAAAPHEDPALSAVDAEGHITALSSHGKQAADVDDIDFLIQVATIIRRVDKDMALDMMRDVTFGLAGIARMQSDTGPGGYAYVRSLAIEAARQWAETRDDAETYEWAASVPELLDSESSELRALQTPTTRAPARYRFEAGLGEWVRATPFVVGKGIAAAELEVTEASDDSGICMLTSERSSNRKSSRSLSPKSSFAGLNRADDLEDRDELSLLTPELVRLRDLGAAKACKRSLAEDGKENVRPTKKPFVRSSRHSFELDDLSEDELGM